MPSPVRKEGRTPQVADEVPQLGRYWEWPSKLVGLAGTAIPCPVLDSVVSYLLLFVGDFSFRHSHPRIAAGN